MARSRLILATLAVLLIVCAALSARHLEGADRFFVIDSVLPGVSPRVAAAGWHVVPPILYRVSEYPATPVTLRADLTGERAATTREGARVDIDVDLTYAIAMEHLLDLHTERGPEYETSWLAPLLRDRAAATIASISFDLVRDRDPEVTFGLRSSIADPIEQAGLRIEGLRVVQAAAAGQSSGDILRADTDPIDRDVVVIGVDSFDWRLLDHLMDQGRMPNMSRLVARGTRANLRTLRPILSPVIWTSIATGVKPTRHGIADFVVADRATGRLVPVTSVMRQVPALWNLASRQGIDVSIVAWWATWPAETVRGTIVTDRVAFQLFEDQVQADWKSADPDRNRNKTYPEGLFDRIRDLIRVPAEVTDAEVAWFLPGGRLPAAPTPEQVDLLNSLRTVIAAGETYHAIALGQLAAMPHGLRMFYYEGPDTASHLFMRYRPPLLGGVDPADMRLFGGIVEKYYERQDRFIGEIVEAAGPDATIVIVSDHGFKSDNNRPPHSDPRIGKGDAADWHTPVGMLLAAGPDIKAGFDLGAASVLDVTPTVLALYGLPVGRDMDGQPLSDALRPEFLAIRPVAWVDTYGGLREAGQAMASGSQPSADDAEVIEKLRSLGYIGDDRMTAHNNRGLMALDEGDVDGAISSFETALAGEKGSAQVSIRTNLAGAYLRKGDLAKARRLAMEALAYDPRNKWSELVLGAAAIKEGDNAEAVSRLERAVAIDPTFVQAITKLGEVRQRQGEDDAALALFRKVVEIAPLSTIEYNNIGNIYRKRGDLDRAMEAYREALRADARYVGAANNLGLCLQERGRLEEARQLYEKALEIRPENPILHNSMGTVLALEGDRKAALYHFERAVRSDPQWPIARGNVATILFEDGRFEEARPAFEKWVETEPASMEPRLGLALTHLMIGNRAASVAEFRRVIAADPDNLRAHIALGETFLKEGELSEARDHLERAARLEGRIPRIFNSLGETYLRLGERQKAEAAFRRSLAIQPDQAEIRRRLANAGR